MPGSTISPIPPQVGSPEAEIGNTAAGGDPHLRSLQELKDYRIQAADDRIGHIEDGIIDLERWHIRYLVLDTRNWLPGGKHVLLEPKWFSSFDYQGRRALVELSGETLSSAPGFEPDEHGAPSHQDEKAIHDHVDRRPSR